MQTPEQHILIEGKPGMGKTTLLLRLAYQIEEEDHLKDWLVPLMFNEEEYGIRKLYKLWERIMELLIEKVPLFASLETERAQLSQQYGEDEAYEKALYQLLIERLKMGRRKLILLMDNFGMFFQKFSESEAHRLRKVLQTSAEIRIIAASAVVLESFYEYQHPFYEFFKIERLEALSPETAQALLQELAERRGPSGLALQIKTQAARIETIRRLCGGVVRTLILLFDILVDSEGSGSAFSDLEQILDRVSPLYKQRMKQLPAAQQEIVACIALQWDAIQVGEIARRRRLESKVVSAQLQQLVKNQIVRKIPTSTKNHLYQISERFFNIWYLMRNGGPSHRSKVLWLTRFIEEWCDTGELLHRSRQHQGHLQANRYEHRAAYLFSEALAQARHLPKSEQQELLTTTREYLQGQRSKYATRLSPSELELQARARSLLRQKQYHQALPLLLQMREKNNLLIAQVYAEGLGDHQQAEYYYRAASQKQNPNAYNQLGILYQYRLHRSEAAEQQFLKAAEYRHPKALFNLGLFYQHQSHNYPKAEQYFRQALQAGDQDARFNLAELYAQHLDQPRQAVALYREVAEQGETKAWLSMGSVYHTQLQDVQEATYCFQMALERQLAFVLPLEKETGFSTSTHEFYLPLLYLLAQEAWDFLPPLWHNMEQRNRGLADWLKPIYYAGLALQGERLSKDYRRMGRELEETVEEVLGVVKALKQYSF